MDTKELMEVLSARMERDSKDIGILVDGFATLMKDRCGKLENIAIPGFGIFSTKKEEEQIFIDERTGKKMLYPPKVTLEFEPSTILKKKISEKGESNE